MTQASLLNRLAFHGPPLLKEAGRSMVRRLRIPRESKLVYRLNYVALLRNKAS